MLKVTLQEGGATRNDSFPVTLPTSAPASPVSKEGTEKPQFDSYSQDRQPSMGFETPIPTKHEPPEAAAAAAALVKPEDEETAERKVTANDNEVDDTKNQNGLSPTFEPPAVENLEDIPLEGEVATPPKNTPSLTQSAIDKRLRRAATPRADGSYKIPVRFVEMFRKKGAERKSLESILASCGYDVVPLLLVEQLFPASLPRFFFSVWAVCLPGRVCCRAD